MPRFSLILCSAILMSACSGVAASQSPKSSIADEVSYTNDIQPIVANFCTTCHHGKNPQGGFVLDSYKDVRWRTEMGTLLIRINDPEEPMPQRGLLPVNLRRLFKKWADGGYVNVGKKKVEGVKEYLAFKPPVITPVDINKRGFNFLAKMQGHWVGSMNLMGQDFSWFAFDYRAIAPSHVHGIFEGGTVGNLFTSFFVTDFKGKRTIMARNGGLLNGLYRTSYFVLSKVDQNPKESRYRFVDAYGGKGVMWIDVEFSADRITLKAYTSRMGLLAPPKEHMRFSGKRMHPELATKAAQAVGFPKNIVDRDFSRGLPNPAKLDEGYPRTSASYLWEDEKKNLVELGKAAKDPYRIDQMPYLSSLKVSVKRHEAITGKKLLMFMSTHALTTKAGIFIKEYGYIQTKLLDGILLFPELSAKQDEFTFTYLHPGDYFLTVIADMNGDGFPSPGDMTHALRRIIVKPKSAETVKIDDLSVKN